MSAWDGAVKVLRLKLSCYLWHVSLGRQGAVVQRQQPVCFTVIASARPSSSDSPHASDTYNVTQSFSPFLSFTCFKGQVPLVFMSCTNSGAPETHTAAFYTVRKPHYFYFYLPKTLIGVYFRYLKMGQICTLKKRKRSSSFGEIVL